MIADMQSGQAKWRDGGACAVVVTVATSWDFLPLGKGKVGGAVTPPALR
jgi:hypothetical protein